MKTKARPAPKSRAKRTLDTDDVRLIVREMIDDLGLHVTQSQLENMAEAAARRAVQATFVTMGLDTNNPLATQKVFGALSEIVQTLNDKEVQQDLAQVRKWRTNADSVKTKGLMTIVAMVTTGVVMLIGIGLKGYRL